VYGVAQFKPFGNKKPARENLLLRAHEKMKNHFFFGTFTVCLYVVAGCVLAYLSLTISPVFALLLICFVLGMVSLLLSVIKYNEQSESPEHSTGRLELIANHNI